MVKHYAENTSVSVEKSRAEIEALLQRYGAKKFMSGWDDSGATVAFAMSNRNVRFVLPLPDKKSKEFTHGGWDKERSPEKAIQAWEQGCRQRWRALSLVIKAKLEAVQCGITSFEDEFLANIIMPGGLTVGEMTRPEIARAYESGKPLQLLSGY